MIWLIDNLNKVVFDYWDRLNNEPEEENIMTAKVIMNGDKKIMSNVLHQIKTDIYFRLKNGGITPIEKIIIVNGNVYKVIITSKLSIKEFYVIYSSIANVHTYDSISFPDPNFRGKDI